MSKAKPVKTHLMWGVFDKHGKFRMTEHTRAAARETAKFCFPGGRARRVAVVDLGKG